MKLRSLLVDDNPLNIEMLYDLLLDLDKQVEVVGKARSGTEALNMIESVKPDLVFLDVEMPDMNGFEVLASLDTIDFKTIFVTAHSHYAIQAIRFNALDYIVKPINPKELYQAIRRYPLNGDVSVHQDQIKTALNNFREKDLLDQVLYLPTQEGGLKMVLRDIVRVEGDRNYSTFYLANGKTKISSKTLGHFEEILSDKGFFRCHRSFIVNHYHIEKIQKDCFLLKDENEIPISRRRKTKAKEWFLEFAY